MMARVRLIDGDHVTIDTDDLDRARQRGRKLIPIRDKRGCRVSRRGESLPRTPIRGRPAAADR